MFPWYLHKQVNDKVSESVCSRAWVPISLISCILNGSAFYLATQSRLHIYLHVITIICSMTYSTHLRYNKDVTLYIKYWTIGASLCIEAQADTCQGFYCNVQTLIYTCAHTHTRKISNSLLFTSLPDCISLLSHWVCNFKFTKFAELRQLLIKTSTWVHQRDFNKNSTCTSKLFVHKEVQITSKLVTVKKLRYSSLNSNHLIKLN